MCYCISNLFCKIWVYCAIAIVKLVPLDSLFWDSSQALGVSKLHFMGDGCPIIIAHYPDAILGAMDDEYPKLIPGLVSLRLSKLRSLIGCLAQTLLFSSLILFPRLASDHPMVRQAWDYLARLARV